MAVAMGSAPALVVTRSVVAIVTAVAGLSAGCGRAAESAHGTHWAYEGEAGPDHWGSISPEFGACATGHQQSPIDIRSPAQMGVAKLAFHYQPSRINILNNGHTVQQNADAGSYLEVDGTRYDLVQIHFHTPSEHTVEGKGAAAEAHLVHRNSSGQFAVVGVLIEAGEANPGLAPLWAHLPAHEQPVQTFADTFAADRLLPADSALDRYIGSLTTPPCTEGVRWMVLTTPVHASSDQIAALARIVGHNNRPVQPLFNRVVEQQRTQ